MRSHLLTLATALAATVLSAQDIMPGFRGVQEGEVFVVFEESVTNGTKTGTVTENHVDKIDLEKKTLTYTISITSGAPGAEAETESLPPQEISMLPYVMPDAQKGAPAPEAPKTDTVEVTIRAMDGTDVKLTCMHGKSEMSGTTSEFWYSTDKREEEIKRGEGKIKVHAVYSKTVTDSPPPAEGLAGSRTVVESWTAPDDLPTFSAVLWQHMVMTGGYGDVETTTKLVEIRKP